MANNFIYPQSNGGTANGGGVFGGNGIGDFVLGSMMGCGGMGGYGGWGGMAGMMYMWPWLFLACGRNGGWFGGDGNNSQLSAIQETLQTMQGNQAVLNAIQGGENEVRELSSQTGLGFNAVQGAIGALKDVVVAVGNQNGLNFNQMLTAVGNGKCDIISQLKDCCCGTKEQILDLKSNMINGLSQIGYALRDQTCSIEKNMDLNTGKILEGQRAAEMREMQDKLNAEREKNQTLTAQLIEARNDAKRKEELLPIIAKLDKIECNQPQTKTVPADCGRYISPCEGLILQLLSANGGGLLRNLLGLNNGGTTATAA